MIYEITSSPVDFWIHNIRKPTCAKCTREREHSIRISTNDMPIQFTMNRKLCEYHNVSEYLRARDARPLQ